MIVKLKTRDVFSRVFGDPSATSLEQICRGNAEMDEVSAGVLRCYLDTPRFVSLYPKQAAR